MALKEYEVTVNGLPHTFKFDEEDAARLGLDAPKSATPKNKGRAPRGNKSGAKTDEAKTDEVKTEKTDEAKTDEVKTEKTEQATEPADPKADGAKSETPAGADGDSENW